MRISIVVQRYGLDIVGGAELHCRGIAERLAADAGHDVEVLTTCARSYITWANDYPAGTETIRGVRVRRFPTERERDIEAFNRLSEDLFGRPHDHDDEVAWLEAQGPYAPRLVDAVHAVADSRDVLVFFTYLYYPTVHGIQAAPERSVLVSTAHDEPPLYLDCYETVFSAPRGIIFGTRAEEALVRRRFSRLPRHTLVAGVGIDDLQELLAAGEARREEARGNEPREARPATLLYAGRIEPGKGVDRLLDYAGRFRADTGVDLRLQLMGEALMEIPAEDWIETLGFVSETEKVERLAGADVVAAPSALESFGLVILEAMAARTPVLANAASEAAVEHCRQGGGLWYRDYPEFREALSLLLGDLRLRRTLGDRGAVYVRDNFSWSAVTARYDRFLRRTVSAPGRRSR